MGDNKSDIETNEQPPVAIGGKRRLQRAIIKGDPYQFIIRSGIQNRKHDGRILEFIYDVRVASRRQLQEYLGLTDVRTRQILSKLFVERFLFRVFPKVDKGSSEGYYFLDSMGASYLAGVYDLPKKDILWSSKENLIGIDKLKHTLGVTEIRIALEKEIRNMDRVLLVQYWGEKRTGRRQFFFDDIEYGLNPDAEAIIQYPVGEKNYMKRFFFEFDRGTEDLNKITDKLRKYTKYYSSEEFDNRYSTKPVLVILCEGETSRLRIEKSISKMRSDLNFFLYVADFDTFLKDPFGEIYEKESQNEEKKIAKLL
jgi:hypothetical protein